MEEIWKVIDGYEGYYEVSNQGRVRSVNRQITCNGVTMLRKSQIRLPGKKEEGYLYVALSKEGVVQTEYIHRLVAISFLEGRTEERSQVNHKNFIKSDNRVENLEWCSALENMEHFIKSGRAQKLSKEDIDMIIMAAEKGTPKKEIAKTFNLSNNTIHKILKGEIYRDPSREYPIGKIKRKLSPDEAEAIFRDRLEGKSLVEIAKKYNIDGSTVSRIANGSRWKNLQNSQKA